MAGLANVDDTEMEVLCEEIELYLKPFAKLNISITLPKLKQPGQSISNWDLMERIKKAIKPIELSLIRVITSTLEIVRFEAECPSRKVLMKVIKVLDGLTLKVIGFIEPLKIRAAEAKSYFPTRHEWDDFFRNEKSMDEMKPGERPDTIYIAKLPFNWFKVSQSDEFPSEDLLQRTFKQFGEIRYIDIPVCDPYRKNMPSSISGLRNTSFSFGQGILFECYVQFKEYISFVRAMDSLKNMKLLKRMKDGNIYEAAIQVDFDRTKHLSEKSLNLRKFERERFIKAEKQKVLEEERRKAEELQQKEMQKEKREIKRLERREKRRRKLERRKAEEVARIKKKMLLEEQSIRLLTELFRRIEADKSSSKLAHDDENILPLNLLEAGLRDSLLREQELKMRKRIMEKMLQRLQGNHEKNSSACSANNQ